MSASVHSKILKFKLESSDIFAFPELYSTLKVANELEKLENEEFNPRMAVSSKLKSSPNTKKNLDEKATKRVNVAQKKVVYKPSVEIEYDKEELLQNAAKLKEAKINASKIPPRTKDPMPDIMEFFTDDLQKEYVSFPNPPDQSETRDLVTAPPECAFTLYRHKLSWQSPHFQNVSN